MEIGILSDSGRDWWRAFGTVGMWRSGGEVGLAGGGPARAGVGESPPSLPPSSALLVRPISTCPSSCAPSFPLFYLCSICFPPALPLLSVYPPFPARFSTQPQLFPPLVPRPPIYQVVVHYRHPGVDSPFVPSPLSVSWPCFVTRAFFPGLVLRFGVGTPMLTSRETSFRTGSNRLSGAM